MHGLCCATLTAVLLLSPVPPADAAAAGPAPAAFIDVTVLPMEGPRELAHQTVVVAGRRIVAMGPASEVPVPAGALRIEGGGRFLMPGLAEMHGHFPGAPLLARYGEDFLDRVLFLNLANGVTTLRGMLGEASHLAVKAEIARGERLGPQLFVAGPSLNGRSAPDVTAARRLVTEERAAGFDLLKIHPGVPLAAFDAAVEVARREGLPFAGHVPAAVGLEHALAAGIASVEHLDGYLEVLAGPGAPPAPGGFFFGFHLVDRADPARIPAIVRRTVAAGAWNTPTEMLFENLFGGESPEELAQRPEMRYLPRGMVADWVAAARQRFGQTASFTPERGRRFLELRRRLIRALQDGGAGLLLGADAPQIFNVPGFATVRELAALVDAGLTPYEALVAGTRSPARQLGLEAAFGTVAVGKRADLLLLDADPLEDIHNVERRAGVMAAGRWLSRQAIEARLRELAVPPG